MIYLCNAFSVSMLAPMWVTEGRIARIERISAKETGEILRTSEWESYFGHKNSAWHLTRYLQVGIPVNRGTFTLTPDDVLLVAAVEGRRKWEDRRSKCPQWKFIGSRWKFRIQNSENAVRKYLAFTGSSNEPN